MKLVELQITGIFGILEKIKEDSRGAFSRVWDKNLVLSNFELNQASLVTNPLPGTLRGLHYQSEPFSENKIIECVTGKVFDVIIDMRKNSNTYGKHLELEIGPRSLYVGLYIPKGFAHGYLTIEPNSTLIYFMDKSYSPEHSKGILWNDPKLTINWPQPPALISERDLNWPHLSKL